MLVRIRQAFIDNLDSVDWMDDVSKKKSIEKMRAMKYNISYYDLHVDAELLDRAYQFYVSMMLRITGAERSRILH